MVKEKRVFLVQSSRSQATGNQFFVEIKKNQLNIRVGIKTRRGTMIDLER